MFDLREEITLVLLMIWEFTLPTSKLCTAASVISAKVAENKNNKNTETWVKMHSGFTPLLVGLGSFQKPAFTMAVMIQMPEARAKRIHQRELVFSGLLRVASKDWEGDL